MVRTPTTDNDLHKGAFETDAAKEKGNTSMRGQLVHRDQDPVLKGFDTDFPEPGGNPEHSGEPEEIPANKKDGPAAA